MCRLIGNDSTWLPFDLTRAGLVLALDSVVLMTLMTIEQLVAERALQPIRIDSE